MLESSVYAIIIDESTCLIFQKQLSLYIRYVKDGEATAKNLANILFSLKMDKLTQLFQVLFNIWKKSKVHVVSLATEGASTIMGKHRG